MIANQAVQISLRRICVKDSCDYCFLHMIAVIERLLNVTDLMEAAYLHA